MGGYKPLRSGIASSEKGAANGVASLNSHALVSQLAFYTRPVVGQRTIGASIGYETTLVVADGNLCFSPLIVGIDATVVRLGVNISSAVAATLVHLGIYESNPDTLAPSTLLVDAGTVDASTTGYKEKTLATPIEAGKLYHVACLPVGGGPTFAGSLKPMIPYDLIADTTSTLGRTCVRRTAQSNLAASAPAPNLAAERNPVVGIRVSPAA